jgi:hypothetical protein
MEYKVFLIYVLFLNVSLETSSHVGLKRSLYCTDWGN